VRAGGHQLGQPLSPSASPNTTWTWMEVASALPRVASHLRLTRSMIANAHRGGPAAAEVGHIPAPHLVGAILQPVRPGRALHRPTGPGAWAAPGHGRPAPARRWPATPTPGQAGSRGGRACGGSGRSRPTARPAPGSPRPPRPAGRGPRRRRSASIPAAHRACQRLTRRRVGHRRHWQARRADWSACVTHARRSARPRRAGIAGIARARRHRCQSGCRRPSPGRQHREVERLHGSVGVDLGPPAGQRPARAAAVRGPGHRPRERGCW
jgi:hypothetical protein